LMLAVILIDRIVYFSLLPTGVLQDTTVVLYIIFSQVPTYLFFSIYTLLVFFWIELVHWSVARKGGKLIPILRIVFIIINLAIYIFLTILLIIYIILAETTGSTNDLSCTSSNYLSGDNSEDSVSPSEALSILYESILMLICVIITICFVIYGIRVLYMLYTIESMSKQFSKLKRNKIIKFTLLLIVCTVSLMGMLVFLIVINAVQGSINIIAVVVFIVFVELVPMALLIFLLYSKGTNFTSFWLTCKDTLKSSSSARSLSKLSSQSGTEEGQTFSESDLEDEPNGSSDAPRDTTAESAEEGHHDSP